MHREQPCVLKIPISLKKLVFHEKSWLNTIMCPFETLYLFHFLWVFNFLSHFILDFALIFKQFFYVFTDLYLTFHTPANSGMIKHTSHTCSKYQTESTISILTAIFRVNREPRLVGPLGSLPAPVLEQHLGISGRDVLRTKYPSSPNEKRQSTEGNLNHH